MKHSIKKQFSISFIIILAGAIGICMIFNVLFLKGYYVLSRQKAMENAYKRIQNASNKEELTGAKFMQDLTTICENFGISVIIMDDEEHIIASILGDDMFLKERLIDYFMHGVTDKNLIIEENNNYMLLGSKDRFSGNGVLEMWGKLDNGDVFMMQAQLESVSRSAYIANRFLFQVGVVSVLIGALSIIILTRKITKPILKLVTISEQMTNLNFAEKYDSRGNNEIDLLGERMNLLSDKLENTISELQTANNELKKDISEKEKNEELRKEFLANVSHELKTPIALIQGYAEGLKEGITDDPESMAFYCDVIVDESVKMNNLVKSLMSLNELESGFEQLTMEHFDIRELIVNYIQSMDIILQKNRINVVLKEENPVYVWTDEFKIEEVFRNYFTNAINHAEGEKRIEISIDIVEDKARISVFNTGKEIPEENLEHIWDKFYKVDKARTREYGGSGVGLSIVKAVMECLHEDYGVENRGDGVCFYFEVSMTEDNANPDT